jgi:imidazolonepropionase-like amidohydrolase
LPDRILAAALAACLFAALGWQPAAGQNLLITNARLFDGAGRPPRESVSILVRDGRIAEIGTALPGHRVATLDVAGATVLPGLIDAHVHLTWGPGDELREESAALWGRFRPQHLRAYLACGVTTVLDAGATPDACAQCGPGWRRVIPAHAT